MTGRGASLAIEVAPVRKSPDVKLRRDATSECAERARPDVALQFKSVRLQEVTLIYDKTCATKDMKRWSFTKARIMMMLTNRFDEMELKLQQDLANLEDELAAMVRSIAQWEREKMMVPMNDVAEYIASENLVTSEAVNLFRQPSFRRIFRVPEDSTHFVRV